VTFITPEGEEKKLVGRVGESLLDLAHGNNVDLEGACEASLACSTCHVILDQKYFDMLDEPSDEENDMLDLAFGLTETSRLGCQVELKPELDGIVARIPSATRNVQQEKLKS
ncbi:2Fe-2S ferredoxin-type domain-containing protein, partial [Cladochytrium replicatum]